MDIAQALGDVASALEKAQTQIPVSETESRAKLDQAYALISEVQASYQGD